jgi:hypothetical protein
LRKKKEDSIIRTGAQGDIGDRKKGIGGTPCWKLYNTLQIPLAGTGLGRVSAHGYDENLVIREYIDCIKYM